MKRSYRLIASAVLALGSLSAIAGNGASGGGAAGAVSSGGAHAGGAAATHSGGATGSRASHTESSGFGAYTVSHASLNGRPATIVQVPAKQMITWAQRGKIMEAGYKPVPACGIRGDGCLGLARPPAMDYYCRRELHPDGFACIAIPDKKQR